MGTMQRRIGWLHQLFIRIALTFVMIWAAPWYLTLSMDRAEASVGSGPAFEAPWGMALEVAGTVVVVDFALRAVLRVDPVSGDRTVVSGAGIGRGPEFQAPVDVAVEATGTLVVLDCVCGHAGASPAVLRVDPVSGDRTVVAALGSDIPPFLATGIAVEAAGFCRKFRF